MIRIEILGSGCANGVKLHAHAEQAVRDLGVQAEIVKVTDMNKIMNSGVLFTPALVINGHIKSVGKLLSVEEIKGFLRAGLAT
ncbi:MAG: thioredoxin family protein [Candidatus Omnitrophica bacterium]|nr:thioredoxin family protein [Candidatus Omnitrophota bacterium]MDD5672454.1 thioredoxin family protein [Candidatus Omnitrophota bacterium]